MKDFEEIVPLIFAIAIAIVLFWGLTFGIKHVMTIPDQGETINMDATIKLQKQRTEEIQRRQKQLMENQKQRIKDLRR